MIKGRARAYKAKRKAVAPKFAPLYFENKKKLTGVLPGSNPSGGK